jgi:hypothetical protein
MEWFYIAIYLDPEKGGVQGPMIQAEDIVEAQRKADEMYPDVEVVACHAE